GETGELRERLHGFRIPYFPEFPGAAYVVFPQARLGFVNAQGNGRAGGQTEVLRRKPEFIKAVTGLMENAEEGGGEVALIISRRQAHIPRSQRGAERVGGR